MKPILRALPWLLFFSSSLSGQGPVPAEEVSALAEILPLRERAELRDAWLRRRLETVVPALMRREGIDTWIVLAREYNEDPVIETMLPASWMAARRRTIFVFHDPDQGEDVEERRPVERLAVARYDLGGLFEPSWDKEIQPDQWARLSEIVVERDPRRIALDVSPTFALADGLSAAEREVLVRALPAEYRSRIVSAENLAIGWLETRIPEEMEHYPTIVAMAHAIIAEGFSNLAVEPGVTSTEDVEWWLRERIAGLKLDTWFHPSVSLQRPGAPGTGSFASHAGPDVIRRGDLLHVDFGITYLGLNTDTQQHAYVLREGEEDAPDELKRALRVGNRLQDLLTSSFVRGRTGNEILRAALEAAAKEGIEGSIYTHPLGFHGHGAGPTIGLWDQQEGVPGRGDYPLHARTVHSIELNARTEIPGWGEGEVLIMLEEDAYFDGESVRYLDGRQTELLLIR